MFFSICLRQKKSTCSITASYCLISFTITIYVSNSLKSRVWGRLQMLSSFIPQENTLLIHGSLSLIFRILILTLGIKKVH